MKKLSILIFILLSIANVACSNKEENKEMVIKKKEERGGSKDWYEWRRERMN